MGQYTTQGPFTNGVSAVNATLFTNIDTAIVNGGMIYFLSSPYQLTVNPTVNSGSTTTLTCTGGSTGVPSGAKAVILGVGLYSASAQGGYVEIIPTGGAGGSGNYVNFSSNGPQNTPAWGEVTTQLSAGGQINVKAIGANCVLQNWRIRAYIM